jgi:hypothetical protein
VYAAQQQPISGPVVFRLIGILDADLIAAFGALESGLVGCRGATVVVDVRHLDVLGETDMNALADVVAAARRAGRDVRLDARTLPWRRVAKKGLRAQPPVDAELRSGARRTVILAHSARRKRS